MSRPSWSEIAKEEERVTAEANPWILMTIYRAEGDPSLVVRSDLPKATSGGFIPRSSLEAIPANEPASRLRGIETTWVYYGQYMLFHQVCRAMEAEAQAMGHRLAGVALSRTWEVVSTGVATQTISGSGYITGSAFLISRTLSPVFHKLPDDK